MHHDRMTKLISYRGYRYPPEVISYAVWLYYRFTLSFRDIYRISSPSEAAWSARSPFGSGARRLVRYTRGDCESVQDAWAIRGMEKS